MNNEDLIKEAEAVLNPVTDEHGRLHGDVGAAVLAKNGEIYKGVCVDTAGWGLCSERSALAAMITAGEYEFEKVVAVWKDPNTKQLYVLPPCGICREFMRSISGKNLNADVILGKSETKKLTDLLPNNVWPEPLE